MLWQATDDSGEVELEIQRRGHISTNIWRVKQNRSEGLIGHRKNLAKGNVGGPGVGKLLLMPLREAAWGTTQFGEGRLSEQFPMKWH